MEETRICKICNIEYPMADYIVSNHYHRVCRSCRNRKKRDKHYENPKASFERQKKWRRNNPDAYRDGYYKRAYGISLKDYNDLLTKQNGACAVCKINQNELDKPLLVDHDHETGKVRGLLCHRCNVLLGYANDNWEILSCASIYLLYS